MALFMRGDGAKNVYAFCCGIAFTFALLVMFVVAFSKTGIVLKKRADHGTFISSLREDPHTGYTYRPHIELPGTDPGGRYRIRINNMGFRGSDFLERDMESPGDKIVFLGDSFTFASGVRRPFADIVGETLNKNADPPVSVLNFGLPGFSTHNQVGVIGKYGRLIHPSLVVLAFYLGNDFRENTISLKTNKIIDGYLVNNTVAWAGRLAVLDDERLRRYVGMATSYHLSPHSMMQLIKVDTFGDEMTFIERTVRQLAVNFPLLKIYTDFFKQRITLNSLVGLRITVPSYYQISDNEISMTEHYLQEMKKQCRRINADLLVAGIPEHLGDYDNHVKRDALKRIIDRLHIEHYIDLYPVLEGDMNSYYSVHDDHLSEEGHAAVASAISRYIEENGLIGTGRRTPYIKSASYVMR